MEHALSDDDRSFREAFEGFRIGPGAFDHRAHLRLAYAYLAESDAEAVFARMRNALRAFLRHQGIDASKYHETMTRAWILAVRHLMERSSGAPSADAFIDATRSCSTPRSC